MELGLFQLENIFLSPSPFQFFDLRKDTQSLPAPLDRLFKKAQVISLGELLKKNLPKEQPVVLVCEDGKTSQEAARQLEAAGHSQTYIVAGGVAGLLSEL